VLAQDTTKPLTSRSPLTFTIPSFATCFYYPMRNAAIVFGIALLLICLWWILGYAWRRRRARPR
jgi:hypothetical protein